MFFFLVQSFMKVIDENNISKKKMTTVCKNYQLYFIQTLGHFID